MDREVAAQLDRIEAKLDALLSILLDEGDEPEVPDLTLDGASVGADRDPGDLL